MINQKRHDAEWTTASVFFFGSNHGFVVQLVLDI
jgi:hypothetical protein